MFAVSGDVGLPMMDDGSRLVAEIAAAAMPDAATGLGLLRCSGGEDAGSGTAAAGGGDSGDRCECEAAGADAGAVAAVCLCGAGASVRWPMLRQRRMFEGEFDLILCDVPCSGTGTLAENPEIRHRLKVEEFARQAARQRAILEGALKRLAPGGRLVYSTCSLEPEECEQVVESVAGSAAGCGRWVDGGAGASVEFCARGWSGSRWCGMGRCGRCRGCMGAMGFMQLCWSECRGNDRPECLYCILT